MEIPTIILDEAERQGLDRTAAYLCDIDGSEIYCLGVDNRDDWLPCPPDAPVLIAMKGGKIKPFDDLGLISGLLETS